LDKGVSDGAVVALGKAMQQDTPVVAFADRQGRLAVRMGRAQRQKTVVGRTQRDALRLKPLDEFVEHFSHAALLDTRLPAKGTAGEAAR
jgi:hypothetical protein